MAKGNRTRAPRASSKSRRAPRTAGDDSTVMTVSSGLAPSRWPRAGPTSGTFEYKNVDATFSGAFSTTMTQLLLNGLVPGTSATTRIGRKVTLRRLDFILNLANAPTTTNDHVALLFVVDRQPNGGNFNATDLLSSATSLSLPNPNEFERFRTIARYDLSFIGSATNAGPGGVLPSLAEHLPLNIPTFFNAGTAGTIADIQTNALFVVAIGSNATGATNPIISGNIRVWYTDA